MPEGEQSYKKHIIDFVNASLQQQKLSIDINKKERDRKEDLYQIFLDQKEKRLIISRYYGSKI